MTALSSNALSAANPFPGLRPFLFADHGFFFGRERQIYALYRLIDRSRFVSVVGSSGSGKSSLVNAGLLPLLQEETGQEGVRSWKWLTISPGDSPLSRLADRLASLSTDAEPGVEAARRERIGFDLRSSLGIAEALTRIDGFGKKSLLLVVDQFEELFRYVSDPTRDQHQQLQSRDEAARFVQLLLEASRSQTHDIHVLLTMRSDFIGDCARFQGLPEAVSAAQFLVPALTRNQREEVIRRPLEQADATINPALVETLLNDSNEDFDQLPVLQHCLRRVWERARHDMERSRTGALEVTLDHYQAVGGMKGALSQHADEILHGLSGLTLAVEQVFRALAETNRGRVIRRAKIFSDLLAETGVPEPDLRRVLDRFRADDCSFLTPSLSATPVLAPDTRVDVGHEALLRGWERVSRLPGATTTQGADAVADGWLGAEEKDGQRYRSLLTRLDGDRNATLASREVRGWLDWWRARPRTQAWAGRYGGRIDQVRRLLDRSQMWRRLLFFGRVASAAFVVVVLLGYILMWIKIAENNADAAQANFRLALNSARNLLSELLVVLNEGTVQAEGAKRIVKTADGIVASVNTVERTPDTAALEVRLWLTDSDVKLTLGLIQEQLDKAFKARDTARDYLSRFPSDPRWPSLLYASLMRVGDALPALGRTTQNLDDSMAAYRQAESIARALAAGPDNKGGRWDNEVAVILGKIGDVWQVKGEATKALELYQAAVDVLTKLTTENPNSWQGFRASAVDRLGQALSGLKRYDEALVQFRTALAIRENRPGPRDDIYQSNVALGHTNIGRALRDKGDTAAALAEFDIAQTIREALSAKDSSSALWQAELANIYGFKGELLLKQDENNDEVLELYRKAYELRRDLALRDNANSIPRQRNAANAGDKFAELLVLQNQPNKAVDVYRSMLETETRLPTKPDDYVKQRRLADLHVTIGDLLTARGDANGGRNEYRAALDIIMQVAARLPADDAKTAEWTGLRESTEEKARKVAPTN